MLSFDIRALLRRELFCKQYMHARMLCLFAALGQGLAEAVQPEESSALEDKIY